MTCGTRTSQAATRARGQVWAHIRGLRPVIAPKDIRTDPGRPRRDLCPAVTPIRDILPPTLGQCLAATPRRTSHLRPSCPATRSTALVATNRPVWRLRHPKAQGTQARTHTPRTRTASPATAVTDTNRPDDSQTRPP